MKTAILVDGAYYRRMAHCPFTLKSYLTIFKV